MVVMNYLWLAGAILSEVIATSSLKASNGFTRLLPSAAVVAGYGTAFLLPVANVEDDPGGCGLCHLVRAGNGADHAGGTGGLQAEAGRCRRGGNDADYRRGDGDESAVEGGGALRHRQLCRADGWPDWPLFALSFRSAAEESAVCPQCHKGSIGGLGKRYFSPVSGRSGDRKRKSRFLRCAAE